MSEKIKKRNRLKDEKPLAKALGFEIAKAGNPFMKLKDGSCVIWVAGKLLGLVTTEDYFGNKLHRACWKSSNKNDPYATLTTTDLDPDGTGLHTEIYYREVLKDPINAIAQAFKIPTKKVLVDHINHKRGDCRRENLRIADSQQNQRNRSAEKVENAFYTLDDLREKIACGEWVPVDNTVYDKLFN